MKKTICLIAISLFVMLLHGKGIDTSVWRNFELIASKDHINPGSIRINLPQQQDGSIADVLSKNSALFIKTYAPGSLATTSMRGMGAQHTAVMWNGINLQSSMNGVIDLNILPMFFIDKAAIETGVNASLCGNGALAGAIVTNTDFQSPKKLIGEMAYGSFGQKQLALGFTTKIKQLVLHTRLFNKSANNDFEYYNAFKIGQPLERIQNNQFQQAGVMQSIRLKLSESKKIQASWWYLNTQRGLPAVMGAASHNEHQNDYNAIACVQYDYTLPNKQVFNSKLAFNSEMINYFNDLLSPAYNTARSLISESQYTIKFKRHLEWYNSFNATYQKAWTDGYRQGVDRLGLSWHSRLTWLANKTFKLHMGNRQMLVQNLMAPSTPDVSTEWAFHPNWKHKLNAAYSFRLPSFNDLYWMGGGNPDLKSEKGKKVESSIEFKQAGFKLGLTGFFHHVNDWIMWVPATGASLWKAVNAKTVESKGCELSSELKWNISKQLLIKWFSKYQYVNSVNKAVYGPDQSIIGKQLFYTPQHTGISQIQCLFNKYRIATACQYVGQRFTTADNALSGQLPAFLIWQLALSREMDFGQWHSSLELTINNLSNVNYMVFENRPMPLRNIYLTYKFNINYEH